MPKALKLSAESRTINQRTVVVVLAFIKLAPASVVVGLASVLVVVVVVVVVLVVVAETFVASAASAAVSALQVQHLRPPPSAPHVSVPPALLHCLGLL
jgi:hypothetical protein